MKKKVGVLSVLVVPLLLTSCGAVTSFKDHLSDYVFAMRYHQNFNILQLTDIHWNVNTSTYESKNYLDKVLKEADRHIKEKQGNDAHIDLVELTGDMFMLSNTYHVDTFLKYFEKKAEEYHFEYASIWGNHDRHGIYHPDWLAKKFANAKHSFYYEPNDNLYGRSNFIINLTADGSKNSEVKWQISNLDSGASFSETSISPFRDYDYIRDDQVEWWKLEHDATNNNAPGIAYYHIPQDENEKMWKSITRENNPATNKNKFFRLEEFASNESPEYESKFIDFAIQNNLKGAFMGHAHNVDWTVEMEDATTHNKLLLGLGVKTGIELYYAHIDFNTTEPDMRRGLDSILPDAQPAITGNFDLIGASLVTITDAENDIQGKFDLEHLYLNERKTNDFVSWVKW